MLRKREGALKRQTNVGYGTQGSKRVNGPLRNVLLAAAVTAKGRHLIQYTCRLIE
jgi:DNA polymerase elongation subunit (family B)